MTDTSALIEGHHLVTSYPAAWCQCHHRLGWETRAEDHAAHVVATIQAQALRDAADVLYGDERAKGPLWHSLSVQTWLRDRADRRTGCPRCCPEPCCDHRNTEYGNCTDCHNTGHNHARCPDHEANRAARLTATTKEPTDA